MYHQTSNGDKKAICMIISNVFSTTMRVANAVTLMRECKVDLNWQFIMTLILIDQILIA